VSELYRATQTRPVLPSVRLVSSAPIWPDVYVQPEYPDAAKNERVEGTVAFIVDVESRGAVNNIRFQSGDASSVGSEGGLRVEIPGRHDEL